MSRPSKSGLEYFPLEVIQDDDVALLEYECGIEGFGILIKLWQKIYANSYYIKWNDDIAILFCKDNNCKEDKLDSVIKCCIRRDLFDEDIFDKYGILTSSGIQKRYLNVCNSCKRKNIHMFKELVLVDDYCCELIHELTELTPELSTQSKVKESKVKKSKGNKKEKNKKDKDEKCKHFDFIWLKNAEYEKLIEKFGQEDADERLEILNDYIGSKGKKYKSHYHTILSWHNKEKKSLPISQRSNINSNKYFDRFNEIYPSHRNDDSAYDEWNKINPNEVLSTRIVNAVKYLIVSDDWSKDNGRWIPKASKWLKTRQWDNVKSYGDCKTCPSTNVTLTDKGICIECHKKQI